jgi:putative transposase
MSVVAEILGVARSNLIKQMQPQTSRSRGRPPLPDAALVEEIKAVIATMPTYGYRRVHAALARRAHEQGSTQPQAGLSGDEGARSAPTAACGRH